MLLNIFAEPVTSLLNRKRKTLKRLIHYLENELYHTTLQVEQSERSSNSIPFSVWDPEQHGQPDYATGFDR